MISTPHVEDFSSHWEPDYRVRQKAVPATITGSHDGQFTCTVDPGHVCGQINGDGEEAGEDTEKYRFRKYQRAQRIIRFLDEPDMPVCRNGRVQRAGKCDGAPDSACYCAQEARLAEEFAA